MGAPLNNQNALGNSGGLKGLSGRKSSYQEKADAEELYTLFFHEFDKKEIEDKVDRGFYSVRDMFLKKAMDGDERILITVFKKVFPDNLNIGGNEINPLRLLSDEELEERLKEYEKVLATLK